MPWSKHEYPQSLKNMTQQVRIKAIEIANALLKKNMGEEKAIAIATAQAEEWAKNRSKEIFEKEK